MDPQEVQLPSHHRIVLDRFLAACQTDERVLVACLVGSYAKGTADTYSDLDLFLLTSDDAYDDFCAGREAFIRRLGEPVFLDDFGSVAFVLFILADGTEGELGVGRESQVHSLFSGPYKVLLDKKHLLTGAVVPAREAAVPEPEQIETLRRQVYWFWHDLSHFTTAMGRGQLWWASGQLEALRLYCVNLARLRQNIADEDVGAEGYFKVEQVLSQEQLSPLQATFCPQEPGTMIQAALVIVRFYQALAPHLAQTHGITYPARLECVMLDRLKALGDLHAK